MSKPSYSERFYRPVHLTEEDVHIGSNFADDDGGAWASLCKQREEQELEGRSARIQACIAQMEVICPPIRKSE